MNRTTSVIAAALVATALQVSAQQPIPSAPTLAARAAAKPNLPRLLPGTKSNVLTTIQGNALNSTNGSLPDSVVRLRDARFGRIVDMQYTDKAGLFAFKVLDPGSYVIEIMSTSNDATVLAASQLIHVNAGEAVSAVVKLPFRVPPFAGVLGHSAPQAAAVTSSAATSGVLATVITAQAEPVSP
jgi:hypothetical protein